MFDIGWDEILVVGLVALIVVGPKDLPELIRTVGGWMRKAREMAGEFQGHVDEMMKDADLADVKKQFDEIRGFDVKGEIEKAIDPKGELQDAMTPPTIDTYADSAKAAEAELGPAAASDSTTLPAPAAEVPVATREGGEYHHPDLEEPPAFLPPEEAPPRADALAGVEPEPEPDQEPGEEPGEEPEQPAFIPPAAPEPAVRT